MRRHLLHLSPLALLLTLAACDKESADTASPEPTTTGEAPAEHEPTAEEKKAAEEEQARADATKRFAEATEEAKAKYEAEAKRFADNGLEEAITKMIAKTPKKTGKALKPILASAHREEGNADRDAYRHPQKTIEFFGIKPTMTVVEAGPGRGWYTEVFAPLLAKNGTLVVPQGNTEGDAWEYSTYGAKRTEMMLAKSPALYGKVVTAPSTYEAPNFGEAGSADVVFVAREMHNWLRNGVWDAWVAAAHDVLKSGGTLAVVQHRAPADGGTPEEWAEKGYLPEAFVIEKLESAGFELVEKSEINANDKDTKDHPSGVWSLPPSLSGGDEGKEGFMAIGESDRMTLKFKKK